MFEFLSWLAWFTLWTRFQCKSVQIVDVKFKLQFWKCVQLCHINFRLMQIADTWAGEYSCIQRKFRIGWGEWRTKSVNWYDAYGSGNFDDSLQKAFQLSSTVILKQMVCMQSGAQIDFFCAVVDRNLLLAAQVAAYSCLSKAVVAHQLIAFSHRNASVVRIWLALWPLNYWLCRKLLRHYVS